MAQYQLVFNGSSDLTNTFMKLSKLIEPASGRRNFVMSGTGVELEIDLPSDPEQAKKILAEAFDHTIFEETSRRPVLTYNGHSGTGVFYQAKPRA